VVATPNGEILSFSYRKVFRTNAKLEHWSKLHELTASSLLGHLDDEMDTPFVIAVHSLDAARGGILCATSWDGYIRLEQGKETGLALAGQLGSERITRIVSTKEGTILRMEARDFGDKLTPPWRFGENGWSIARFDVPFERHPDDPKLDEVKVPDGWLETEFLAGADGTLYTVSIGTQIIAVEGRQPATMATVRWRNGKPELLSLKSSQPQPTFVTPDGSLWSVNEEGLRRLVHDRWTTLGALTPEERQAFESQTPSPGEIPPPWDDEPSEVFRVLSTTGPPWFIINSSAGELHRFSVDVEYRNPKIEPVKLSDDGKKIRVLDALRWTNETLLLATDKGLRSLEITTGKLIPSGLSDPGHTVSALSRDGLGRAWLAGDGIWLVDPDGKRLHPCDALPMLDKTRVVALAADRDHRDGVIASIGRRGVVFVRVY
jgi:hypothetical protein